jgi:hypothetical protein
MHPQVPADSRRSTTAKDNHKPSFGVNEKLISFFKHRLTVVQNLGF